ncbi:MAG: hypothetical protein RIE86_26870 [Imperialibacter sp.]|uniref:hypothetical protein n=1 Tax=Imperialibacter sp. TaxID=2038411 RepID=UPI0032EB519F
MKIHLKKGIDKLRFGMTPSDVENFFGKPSRELIDSDDENELIWEYADQKLRLTFYQNEGDRLGYMRSSNSNLTINGFKIIDNKIEDVKSQIDSNPESWEEEDYDSFNTYFLESAWLTLNVEYERVTDIELGVPFKNEDEYDWPQ